MKVIFLDFDGVLNSAEYMLFNKEEWNSGDDAGMIDPDSVALVNQIIEKTGAKVVISSSWRLGHTIDELKTILKRKGFIGEVIGMTPPTFLLNPDDEENKQFSERGHEIQKWLRTQKETIESFVILDDESDMVHLKPRLVQTTWRSGINETHIEAAIKMLETPTAFVLKKQAREKNESESKNNK